MISSHEDIITKLQNDPETLSDDELTQTSLSVFSKFLGGFTSRRTINAYLRWLELQRTAPRRNINFNWLNTIAYWTQSLRARSFSLEEINREVILWKEENGPFVESNPSDPESRLPPTSANLAFGWDRTPLTSKIMTYNENSHNFAFHNTSRIYDSQVERKLDSPLTKVPTSYVCNRCKGRGHYVGDCPTNEDPTYDIAAGTDYVCKFCKERATHYFLFCPKNPDPNSIYRRRQEKAHQNVPQSHLHGNMALRKTARATQSSPQPSPSATSTQSNIVVSKVPSSKANCELFTNSKRKGSRDVTTSRLSFEKNVEDIETDSDSAPIIYNQSREGNKNKMSTISRSETLECADSELFWEKITKEIQTNRSRGAQKQFEVLTELPITDQTMCTPAAPVANNQSSYAEFIIQLFAKHPNQVNPMYRPRMKALDMWDINDKKGLHLEAHEESTSSEQNFSVEPRTPDFKEKKNIHERFNREVEESKVTSGESNTRQSKQFAEQMGFMIDMKGFQGHKECKPEQTESPTHRQKLRAIRRKINSIGNLRTRLELGDDVNSSEMEQMASGDLSQEVLDNLANRLQTQNAPFKS